MSKDALILRVAAENVAGLWPQLEPQVAAALRGSPTHTPEDVRRALLGLTSHLFVHMDEGRLRGFIISEFAVKPRGAWLHVWLAGAAPDTPFALEPFLAMAKVWAQHHGCKGFQISGARPGWAKKFPQAVNEGVNLRWTFDEAHDG